MPALNKLRNLAPVETVNLKSGRIQSIDALRAIAAFFVLFCHSSIEPFPTGITGVRGYDIFLNFFGKYGGFGVDLFFIVSGFCIHWGYLRPEIRIVPAKYLERRWWRIYPPYFFALSIAVLFNFAACFYKWKAGGGMNLDNFGAIPILSHLLLVHNFFNYTATSVCGPFWTIAVEAQFYLLYLLARPLFFSKKGWFGAFLASAVLYGSAKYFFKPHDSFQPLQPFQYWMEWIAGAFIAYLIKNDSLSRRQLILWGAAWIPCYGLFTYLERFTHPLVPPVIFSLENFMIVFAVLVFMRLEKIWSQPVLKGLPFLGTFSYSIYLVHFPIMDRLRTFVIPNLPLGAGRFAASLAGIFLCLVLSYLFFLVFEKPFLAKSASIGKY